MNKFVSQTLEIRACSYLMLGVASRKGPKGYSGIQSSNKVTIAIIPEGTTGLVQPWDTFGARPWRNFTRRLSELLKRADPSIHLYERNMMKLQSLAYNQLHSPR